MSVDRSIYVARYRLREGRRYIVLYRIARGGIERIYYSEGVTENVATEAGRGEGQSRI